MAVRSDRQNTSFKRFKPSFKCKGKVAARGLASIYKTIGQNEKLFIHGYQARIMWAYRHRIDGGPLTLR